jgi:hypothetical protein
MPFLVCVWNTITEPISAGLSRSISHLLLAAVRAQTSCTVVTQRGDSRRSVAQNRLICAATGASAEPLAVSEELADLDVAAADCERPVMPLN